MPSKPEEASISWGLLAYFLFPLAAVFVGVLEAVVFAALFVFFTSEDDDAETKAAEA
ncbi:hypothetical protein [Haloarchaeobius sp. DFWS5]|uniref:hypothetical protein n=1 Tax=Haloarchaeobius sp. DFWS5 TaxID=3446114 RepID=UPI003EBE934B